MSISCTRWSLGLIGAALVVAGGLALGAVWYLGVALAAVGLAFLVGALSSKQAPGLRLEMRRMASNPPRLRRTTITTVVVAVLGGALVAAGDLGWVIGGMALLFALGMAGFVVDAWRAVRAAQRAERG